MTLNMTVPQRDFAGRSVNTLSQQWGTPEKYVKAVREMFGGRIDLDPCSPRPPVVEAGGEYRLPKHAGVSEPWNFPPIYVTPPYGADRERGTTINHWLRRCAEANRHHGSEVLALVPVASNTGHWKKHVWGVAAGIAFLYDTRLRFLVDGKDEGKGAPMACSMVYWGGNFARFQELFLPLGAVVDLAGLKGAKIGGREEASQQPMLEDL